MGVNFALLSPHLRQCGRRSWRALYRAAPFLVTCSCSRLLNPPSFASGSGAAAFASASPALLRVATFNIGGDSNLERLAQLVASDPGTRAVDVLLIQELAPGVSTEDLERMGAGLGLAYAHTAERHVGGPNLALLSRYPLEDPEILYLPQFDLGYRSRRRIAIAGSIDVGGERIRFYNVHLDTRIRLHDRIRQMEPVVFGALASQRVIVGGDLNTIRSVPITLPWVPLPLPGFSQAHGLDQHMKSRGFAAPLESVSWTGPLRMRLDAFFARGLEPGDRGAVVFPGFSDHVALWLDLALGSTGNAEAQ